MHGIYHGPAKTAMEAIIAPLGERNSTLSRDQRQITSGGLLSEEDKGRINTVLAQFEKTPEMKAERFPGKIEKVHNFKGMR